MTRSRLPICPECGEPNPRPRTGGIGQRRQADHDYQCVNTDCAHEFDAWELEHREPKSGTDPTNSERVDALLEADADELLTDGGREPDREPQAFVVRCSDCDFESETQQRRATARKIAEGHERQAHDGRLAATIDAVEYVADGGEELTDAEKERIDGDGASDRWRPECPECGREVDRRDSVKVDVHVDLESGGYDRVPMHAHRKCAARRRGWQCEDCGEHYLDQLTAWQCCTKYPGGKQPRIPDGGEPEPIENLLSDIMDTQSRGVCLICQQPVDDPLWLEVEQDGTEREWPAHPSCAKEVVR